MKNIERKSFIENENLWKVMFKLSWPAVIAMILYGLNTLFDAIFIGRFVGEQALAGISLAYPLTQIALGVGSLIGVGAGSLLSIVIGSEDINTQKRVLGNVNFLNIICTIIFMVGGLLFTKQLIVMMGGQGSELIHGSDYLRVTIIGAFFWISGIAGNMIVRSEGKMKSAAVMMGFGLIMNIIANYILIVVFDFGVKGAAWGTNLGMFIYTITTFIYFASKRPTFEGSSFSLYIDKKIIKQIMSMGIPSFIMSVMTVLQGIVVLNAISNVGTTSDIAFYGVTFRIFTFMLTPIFGLMRALQPAVGINFGAGKIERVIKSFKVFAVAATILVFPFWILLMCFSTEIFQVALPSKILTSLDLMNFRIFISLLPILPIIFMTMTFFPAINKGKIASIIGISRQLIFYVPVMLILPLLFGVKMVYIGAFFIDFIIVLWAIFLVKKEFQLLRRKQVDFQNF